MSEMQPSSAEGARRPVRVLFLHPFAQQGGSENVLKRLLGSLGEGFEATLVLMSHGPLEDEFREMGVTTHVVPLPGKRSVPRFPFAARALAERLGGGFDLLHANGTKAALFGSFLSRQLDLPVLWMKHGHDYDWWAPRMIGPSCDRIACVSGAVAATFPDWLAERVTVCHPGVRLPPDPGPAARTEPLVLAVGRVDPLKGPANLVRALSLLSERGVEGRLAIAGPSDPKAPQHRAELDELIAELGLSDRAEVLGWVPDIDALYASSRVVALASRNPRRKQGVEGTPLVLLEGMSHGRPVVAPRDGGIAEIVDDAGTLVESAEPEDLADGIEPFLTDPELAGEVGARGRRRVESEFRLEQMTERLSAEYERLARREHLTAPAPAERQSAESFSQSKRIARNTIARSIGEVVAKLASIAFYVVMARQLGGEDFGNFIFGLSLSSIVLIGAGFGMDQYLARELARDRSKLDTLLTNVLLLKAMMLFGLMGVLAGIVLIGPYSEETRLAVVLVGLGVGIEMLTQTLHGVTQAYERMSLGALGLVLQRLATAIVGIAILLSGGGLVPATIVFVGGSVFGYVVSYVLMRQGIVRPRFHIDRSQWMQLLKAGAPIGAASLMFTVLLRLDAALISFFTNGDQVQVGHYGAAYRLVDATMFIGVSFSAAMLPWLARQGSRDLALLTRGSVIGLKLLTAVLLPIGTAYIVFAPELIDLLYGPEFADAVLPLRFLGAMTVLYGINWYASSLLIARHRPGAFARGIAAVLVGNVVLNVFLIPPYGASGAAAAAVVSGIALAVYSVRQVWETVGRFTLTRAFAGPLAGSIALAAVPLLTEISLWPALVISGLAYLAVLAAFERTTFPDDYDLVLGMAGVGRGRADGTDAAQPDDSL